MHELFTMRPILVEFLLQTAFTTNFYAYQRKIPRFGLFVPDPMDVAFSFV